MVKNARAESSPDTIRALSVPLSVEVKPDTFGLPTSIKLRKRWLQVEVITDRWRIDDEWWRSEPASRMYYFTVVDQGLKVTMFQDLLVGHWFLQKA